MNFIGVHKTPKGWLALRIKTQGRKVIDEEVLTEGPESRMAAENRARVVFVQTFLMSRDDN